jgi:hypothetical protein
MAPRWAKAVRPLVLVFIGIAFLVTWYFKANVDAQGGAYATGVLVLITSASVAVTLSARTRGQRRLMVMFAVISAIFVYTTADNIVERPDGVRIGGIFVLAILAVSFASRARRAFELRATDIRFDDAALAIIDEVSARGEVRIVANEPNERDAKEYKEKSAEIRRDNDLPVSVPLIFLEVTVDDASDFETALFVRGEHRYGNRILCVSSPAIANAIAELLLDIRDRTGRIPHAYFSWTEGNPVRNFLRFLFIGDGEVAPVTREVLREAEPDPDRRPRVHVS